MATPYAAGISRQYLPYQQQQTYFAQQAYPDQTPQSYPGQAQAVYPAQAYPPQAQAVYPGQAYPGQQQASLPAAQNPAIYNQQQQQLYLATATPPRYVWARTARISAATTPSPVREGLTASSSSSAAVLTNQLISNSEQQRVHSN